MDAGTETELPPRNPKKTRSQMRRSRGLYEPKLKENADSPPEQSPFLARTFQGSLPVPLTPKKTSRQTPQDLVFAMSPDQVIREVKSRKYLPHLE